LFVAAVVAYKDYGEYSNLRFVVDAESSQRGCSQIFFDTGNGYNEQESYSAFVEDGGFQQHVYPLPSKEIKSIRFDPVNISAVVKVRNARIENQHGHVIKTFLPEDFERIQQINKVEISNGILTIYVYKNANDPILIIKNSSINNRINWLSYVRERGWIITGCGLISFLILIALNYLSVFAVRKQYVIGMACFFSVLLSFVVIARWWYYIYTYSVNILFWDQWDLYTAFIENKNIWELFRWQHGPHRQGIGFIIAEAIALLSGWNTRAESFAIGVIVCLAMFAAIFLRNKLGPRLSWADAAIPLIFLTPLQFELFAGTPNLSHGSIPLLLLLLYVLVWAYCIDILKYTGILTLNFLLIYTGFGVFVGMITPCIFCAETLRAYRASNQKGVWLAITGLVISLLSAASFFVGYRFMSAVDNFQFPIREWWLYLQFMALMLANFCGIKSVTVFSYSVGFFLLFFMSVLALVHAGRTLHTGDNDLKSSRDTIIAVLTSFTIIFCLHTAVGRISLGLSAAYSSRYITYLIPGFFGIYLWMVALKQGTMQKLLLIVTVAGLIAANFPLRETDRNTLKWYAYGKSRWKAAYMQNENIKAADHSANFAIYPVPERTHLKQKLECFKKVKINLYVDVPSSQINP
jgi:hypothetical protein